MMYGQLIIQTLLKYLRQYISKELEIRQTTVRASSNSFLDIYFIYDINMFNSLPDLMTKEMTSI